MLNACKNCCEPEVQAEGVIELVDGLCEVCRENDELCKVLDAEEQRNGDFDYSMNS